MGSLLSLRTILQAVGVVMRLYGGGPVAVLNSAFSIVCSSSLLLGKQNTVQGFYSLHGAIWKDSGGEPYEDTLTPCNLGAKRV